MIATSNNHHREDRKEEPLTKISLRISQLLPADIPELEKTLSKSDLCSLIFLLCDNVQDKIVLQDLYYNLSSENFKKSCMFWPLETQGILLNYLQCSDQVNWKEKLIEALLVIQNYGILKKFLNDINDGKVAFKSRSREHAVHIHPLRKLLYLFCDDLSVDDWSSLCTAVNIEKGLLKDEKQHWGMKIPEISLLHWSSKGVINIKSLMDYDIAIIQKHLQLIRRDDWVAVFSNLRADSCFSIRKSLDPFSSAEQNNSSSSKTRDFEDRYDLSKGKGVCLIFNQELIQGFDEPRRGTTKDAEYLEKTFKCFGFDVVQRKNICASDIIKQICFYSSYFKPISCFVVAILSHGEKNVIKGSDGGDVNIDLIERTLLRIIPLADKPKVLIIQACQADLSAPLNSWDDIETDGGPGGHLFVFMAALPGDFAYRHKVLGSFFINHLCDALLENSQNANWTEIVRLCNVKMGKEKFAFLMPWYKGVSTKRLILVAPSEATAKQVLQEELQTRRNYQSKST